MPRTFACPAVIVAVTSSMCSRIKVVVRVTSSAARADSSANWRTSSATTAKPRPCSPARAASMAALSASRLVCEEMRLIRSTKSSIAAESCASSPICRDVVCRSEEHTSELQSQSNLVCRHLLEKKSGQHQRHYAHDEGHGGHEDRAEPQVRDLEHRRLRISPVLLLQMLCELDASYGVLTRQSH